MVKLRFGNRRCPLERGYRQDKGQQSAKEHQLAVSAQKQMRPNACSMDRYPAQSHILRSLLAL